MVSTMASGNVSHYVGETNLTMMYSVVDAAGMNPILETIRADSALLDALRSGLGCSMEELDVDINDPSFALMIATTLHELLQTEAFGHNG